MATTFRNDAVAAITGLLQTFAAANPTLLKAVHRRRPGSFPDHPLAYIGERAESLTHDSGTRTRTFLIPVVVVDVLADNVETADRFDDLVDLLIDLFTANPQVIPNTIIEPVAVADLEVEAGVPYGAVSITLRGIVMEGRS